MPRWTHRFWIILILLAAAWLRLYRLDDVPPGWRDDEVVETTVHAALAATGLHLYFPQAEGHEPLYHYLSAGWIALVGRSLFSVRLLSAFLGVLSVAALYRLARRLFGAPAALLAAAGLALSFWGLMYSRFKLRHVSEVVFMLLAFDLLLRLVKDGPRRASTRRKEYSIATLAGVCLAAALYTYFAARVVPVIFIAFAAYLWLFHRPLFRARWRAFALTGTVAVVLTLPLIIAITLAPGGEERLGVVGQPLLALLAGDPRPVLRNTVETLGMVAFTGDPEFLYNIPGRPVFGWSGALLLLVGLLFSLRRWRDPRHAFLLLWLLGGLAPAFLSTPAASLGHTIAAQPAVFLLPAVGIIAVGGAFSRLGHPPFRSASLRGPWSSPQPPSSPRTGGEGGAAARDGVQSPPFDARKGTAGTGRFPPSPLGRRVRGVGPLPPSLAGKGARGLGLLVGLLYVATLAARDLPDYFVRWPVLPAVRYLYRADLQEAGPALRALPAGSDLALTSRTLHPADALALALETPGQDLRARVFSPDRAWLFPERNVPVLLRESTAAGSFKAMPGFSTFAIDSSRFGSWSQPDTPLAADLVGGWRCTGYTVLWAGRGESGTALLTFWEVRPEYLPPPVRPTEVLSGTPLPFKFFTHLLNPDGSVLAGEDRLDVDPATLRPGDTFIQMFVLLVPDDAAPGAYPLQIGLYDPITGARVPLTTGGDALRLTTLDLP